MKECKSNRTAYNKAYRATVLRISAKIPPIGWTSDTLGPLGDIALELIDVYGQ